MQEVLLKIQEACLQLDGLSLGAPAGVGTLMGLILWLGGNRYAAIVIGILGAMVGAFTGLWIGQWLDLNLTRSVPIGGIVMAILAILMKNIVIIFLATVIFALTCGSGYLSYSLNSDAVRQKINEIKTKAALGQPMEEPQADLTDSATQNYLRFLAQQKLQEQTGVDSSAKERAIDKLKEAWAELQYAASANKGMLIMWILIGAAVGLLIAYLLKKIVMALCCSIVGSAGVIGGACALLMAKKTEAISSLIDRPQMTMTLFVGMILFGFIMQLLFTGKKKKEIIIEKEVEK